MATSTDRRPVRTTLLMSTDDWPLSLVPALIATGPVVVVLLDRAADLTRPAHPAQPRVTAALDAGADVLVDTAALRRRGIDTTGVAAGIKPTDLSAVGDLLVDGTDKVVWL